MRFRSEAPALTEAVFLGHVLAGSEAAACEAAATPWPALAEQARRQGVLPLLASACGRRGSPLAIHALRAAEEARVAVAHDLAVERADRELVEALADRSLPAFLIKGADLAYGVYARSDLRPRVDTDLLVRSGDRSGAREVLRRLGYRPEPQAGGDLVSHQEAWIRDGHSTRSVVDLHWRVANPQRFGRVLDVEEIAAGSEPRTRLSPAARGLGLVHALLLACVHRVAHHYDATRLIWACDVDLVASRLSDRDWQQWVRLAVDRRVAAACCRGFLLAERTLGTRLPAAIATELAEAARDDADPYVEPEARHAARVWVDLRHTGSWKERVALLNQHLFPPAAYMRTVYAPASRLPLAGLYATRLLRGASRWLKRG